MQNPFESGHIKNYILLYASIVIIMILFFIATSLFNDIKEVEPKIFNTKVKEKKELPTTTSQEDKPHFKLLDKVY
ncbi:hypothetical protein [Sulfurimonas sp.]